jgi:hypothetical protein
MPDKDFNGSKNGFGTAIPGEQTPHFAYDASVCL